MIYFKCSQCGERMEAPAPLKGQLLTCPKCGSNQTVKDNCWWKISLVLILLLIFVGIYKAGIFVGYKNGEENGTSKEYQRMQRLMPAISANAYKEGEDAGIKEGYEAAMSVKNWDANSHEENNIDAELPVLVTNKSSEKFPCKNVYFDTSDDTSLRIIGEITNDSNRTYSGISLRITLYDEQDVLIDTGSFMIFNFEKKQTRSFEAHLYHSKLWSSIHHYKIDFDAGM